MDWAPPPMLEQSAGEELEVLPVDRLQLGELGGGLPVVGEVVVAVLDLGPLDLDGG